MQPKIISFLIARWRLRWKQQDMSWRLRELSIQIIGYLLITIVLIGFFGLLTFYILPLFMVELGTKFLAILYLLILLITTAHCFDENHTKYLLEKLESIEDKLDDMRMKEGYQ